jgi:hypothetical protein
MTSESGQAAIGILLMFGVLTIAGLAFAVDFANLWFHRQAAQSAADAACQAGSMDMLATTGGVTLNSKGFTTGTDSSCTSSPSATMCTYAGFNGYSGAGPLPTTNTNSEWNTVSWTFPASVPNVTAPPASMTATPYMQVTIVESVKTFFVGLFTASSYQRISSVCTCGLAQIKEPAPILVLHPTMSGSLSYSGGAILKIIGGPQRSIQVNSSSATAAECSPSGYIDTSGGGPASPATGSDVGIVGAEVQSQDGCWGSGGYKGFNGGTSGAWRDTVLPVPDPYSGVAAPTTVKTVTPVTYSSSTGNYYTWVAYGVDGCPDHNGPAYAGNGVATNCAEFGPGYYPNGIPLPNNYSTIIFLPGVYYVNGSLSPGGSNTIRPALPCWSSYISGYSAGACSTTASANHLSYSQTQGIMFYFSNSGTFSVGGGASGDTIDKVPGSALTCDGSSPSASLGMPSSGLAGNVLWAQCTANGTYWDSGGDTTDSAGNPGTRGLLFFQDHADTTNPSLSGSGELAYAGSLYFHSTTYADLVGLSGGAGTGTYILGDIVADKIQLSGSAVIAMQLSPNPSTYMLKATTFQ